MINLQIFFAKAKALRRKIMIYFWFYRKRGLEIGGPSAIFAKGNYLPLYPLLAGLDGVNFGQETVWEGKLKEGNYYNYCGQKSGYQFISEATKLKKIKNKRYDFVISSNALEHLANPLKAIREWRRVIKPKGYLLLILPDKRYTFDHCRKTTSFDHLIQDEKREAKEDDLTHLQEIFKKHDLSLDPRAGSRADFKKRSLDNFKNRCLHHHIFDLFLLRKIFTYCKVKTILAEERGDFQLIIGRKI